MKHVFEILVLLLKALILFKQPERLDDVLATLLSKHLGLNVDLKLPLSKLDLSDYGQATLSDNRIKTVKDAVLTYCLRKSAPGIGDKTWKEVFDQLK